MKYSLLINMKCQLSCAWKSFFYLRAREQINMMFEMILLFLSFHIIFSIAKASDVSLTQMRTCGLHPRYFKKNFTVQANYLHWFQDWFDLEFYGPVKTNKVMSSQSVNLPPLFLGIYLVLWMGSQYFVRLLLPVTDNRPSWISRKWRMTKKKTKKNVKL